MSALFILEIRPLSEVSLANMFSHTVGSLFILTLFFFSHEEAFYLDEVSLVYSFQCNLSFHTATSFCEDVAVWNV